jgi:hypothetical protein
MSRDAVKRKLRQKTNAGMKWHNPCPQNDDGDHNVHQSFLNVSEDSKMMRGRCHHYGESVTYQVAL